MRPSRRDPDIDRRPGGPFAFCRIRRPNEPELFRWTLPVFEEVVLVLRLQDDRLTAEIQREE